TSLAPLVHTIWAENGCTNFLDSSSPARCAWSIFFAQSPAIRDTCFRSQSCLGRAEHESTKSYSADLRTPNASIAPQRRGGSDMHRVKGVSVFVCVVGVLLPAIASAQASISGTVRDVSGG